jgi:hypothetical protein
VTICIAAACNHAREGGRKIILCTDWRVGSFLGSAETKHKQEQDYVARGFHCPIAGDPREVDVVIGEGEFLARASLLRREMSNIRDFGAALYEVYEAKKAAERVGSVGPSTLISVLEANTNRRSVDVNKMDYFERLYSRYGLRNTPDKLDIPEDLFRKD